MGSLVDTVKDPAKRKLVVDAGVRMIEAEVADKGGLSGLAIKGAFKLVSGIKPGFVGGTLNHLLDDFSAKVDPFWADCQQKGEDPRGYFVRRGPEIANALLSITDDRAKNARGPVKNTYDKLRPEAVKHVTAAMPRLADMVKTYAS